MAFPNTEYPRSFASEAVPGQLGDNGPHRIEAHRNNEGADVPAGILVTASGDEGFELIDAAGDVVLGALLNSYTVDPNSLADEDAIKEEATANVLTEGPVWVRCEEAMAVGDTVHVRHTANGAGKLQLGAVRNDTDSGNARACKGARVIRGSSGAGVVLLQISGLLDKATIA